MKTAKRLLRVFWNIGVIIGCITATTRIVRDICRVEHGFQLFILLAIVILWAVIAILEVLRTLILEYADWKREAVTQVEITD